MPNPGPSTTITPNTQAVVAPQNSNRPDPFPAIGANQLRLLAVAKGVNVNAVGDQASLPIINATEYAIERVVMTNASISLTAALAGLFTLPAAGGTAVVANAALSGYTGPTIVAARTVASTIKRNDQTLYLNVGTAQGAPATIDVYVYGYDFSPQ